MKAIVASADFKLDVVEFNEKQSYETIRDAVDGMFDCVRLPSLGVDMWVNDEGKINNLDLNPFGTALWVSEYGMTDIVVGDVIITGGTDGEGKTLGMTNEQAIEVLKSARAMMDELIKP
jgi:hypothetical protein